MGSRGWPSITCANALGGTELASPSLEIADPEEDCGRVHLGHDYAPTLTVGEHVFGAARREMGHIYEVADFGLQPLKCLADRDLSGAVRMTAFDPKQTL